MLRSLKKIFFFIFIFISINILIALIFYPLEDTISNQLKTGLSKEIEDLTGVPKKEIKPFVNFHYRSAFYDYDEIIGWKRRHLNTKYLKIDDNGRHVPLRPKECHSNILMFGSSTLFGTLLKDEDTISNYLQLEINKKKIKKCVFNFAVANFNSTHENLYLIKKILNNQIKENDIIIFLDGATELLPNIITHELKNHTYFISNKKIETFKYYSIKFLENLPIYFLYEKLNAKQGKKNKIEWVNNDILKNLKIEKTSIFKKNLFIRNELCKIFNIRCFTFIEPFGYITQKNIEEKKTFVHNGKAYSAEFFQSFYKTILESNYDIENISNILKNNKNIKIKYLDHLHYSPQSSKKIANEILKKIN